MEKPIPKNEAARLKALQSYNILDTLPEERFDRLTRIASSIFNTPIALISLIDKNRQWFKSRIGLPAKETHRDISFCQHAIMNTVPFVVNDAVKDERFRLNPLVQQEPNIRFYAGQPILDRDGFTLGTLCIIDRIPRELTEEQLNVLKDLADEVMENILSRQESSRLKKTIDQLEKKDNELSVFFQNSSELLCTASVDGKFLKVSDSWLRFLGLPRDQIEGAQFFDFIDPHDIELTTSVMQNLISGERVSGFQNSFRFHDGTYRKLEWNSAARDGIIYAIARDKTDEIQSTEILNNTLLLLSDAQRIAKLGAWELDLATGKTTWTDQVYKIHEVDTDFDHNKANGIEFYHPDYRDKISKAIDRTLKTFEPFDEVCKFITAKGNLRWVRSSGHAIIEDGKPVKLLGSFQDITETKNYIDELAIARQIADEANLAKSDFLSSMSHELRTPLNSIMGFSQILKLNSDNNLNTDDLQSVEYIEKSGRHLLNLITDILDLSKIESGEMTFELEILNLKEVICDLVIFLEPVAKKQNVKLINSITDQNLFVLADLIRLKQVFMNLISNSIKYNKPGGFVNLSISACTQQFIEISVTDNGLGISEENQKKLFQPFQRLGAEKTETEGTGIGLVITKRLLYGMAGSISFTSTLNEGSEFRIRIPAATPNENFKLLNQSKPHETQADLQNRTILYIEDNPDNVKLMEMYFKKLKNMILLTAHTGKLGLEVATSRAVDLVMLDINLPGMDGFEIFKKLQQDIQTRNIPVIAVSAAATRFDIQKAMDAGFTHYISKPFQFSELSTAIDSCLKT